MALSAATSDDSRVVPRSKRARADRPLDVAVRPRAPSRQRYRKTMGLLQRMGMLSEVIRWTILTRPLRSRPRFLAWAGAFLWPKQGKASRSPGPVPITLCPRASMGLRRLTHLLRCTDSFVPVFIIVDKLIICRNIKLGCDQIQSSVRNVKCERRKDA